MIKPDKLCEGFRVLLDVNLSSDGEVSDLRILSAATGEDFTNLVYGTTVWDAAWDKAQAHADALPTAHVLALQHIAETCHDTPYAL